MFTQENLTESEKLDKEITRLIDKMKGEDPTDEKYAKMADQLTKLFKLKDIDAKLKISAFEAVTKQKENDEKHRLQIEELNLKQREFDVDCEQKNLDADLKKKQNDAFGKISLESWAAIGANLAGILLILNHERANVITTKALGFLRKT